MMSFKQFFLTEEKEVPKDTLKEPSPVKNLVKKAGKIDITPLKKSGEILLQWMRNKEAKPEQKFGNQEVVFQLTPETFEKYIVPSIKTYSIPLIKKAKSFEEMMNVIHSKIPNGPVYMKVFKVMNKSTKWNVVPSDDPPLATEETILPYSNKGTKWVLQVSDFNSPEAQLWGSTADSDIYANIDPFDKKTK